MPNEGGRSYDYEAATQRYWRQSVGPWGIMHMWRKRSAGYRKRTVTLMKLKRREGAAVAGE